MDRKHDQPTSSKTSEMDPVGLGQDVELEKSTIYLWRRRIRTICMAVLQGQIGLYIGILGPALPELQEQLHVDVASVSEALMFQFLGIALGSVTAAYVCDVARRHADLILCAVSVVNGLLNMSAPWAPNLIVLGLIYCLAGVCQATIDTACNALVMLEWGNESGSPLNFLQASFTLGLVLAPLTVQPFLTEDELQTGTNMTLPLSMNNSYSNIVIPYGIHGSMGVLAGFPFLCFYIHNWTYKELNMRQGFLSKFKKIEDKRTVIIAVVAFFLTGFMTIRDNALALFNFKIAIDKPLNFTKAGAALYVTSYNLCLLVSRIFGIFITKWVSCHLVIFSVIALAILSNLLLLVLGMKSKIYFWMTSCAFPLVIGPYYPTLMAWINVYIPATGAMVASIITGLGTGGFLTVWISGHLYEYHGPQAIFGEMLAASTMLLIVSIPVQVHFNKTGKRLKKEDQEFDIHNAEMKSVKNLESMPLITDKQ